MNSKEVTANSNPSDIPWQKSKKWIFCITVTIIVILIFHY